MTIKVYAEALVNKQTLTVDTTGELAVRLKVGHAGYRGMVQLSYLEVDDLVVQLTHWLNNHACDDTTLGDMVE